jgi:exopolysaccharide biosynthesis protein
MKKFSLILLSAILILIGCSQRSLIELTATEKIDDHIVWKVIQTPELEINGLPATINILDVDLKNFDGDIDLAWYPEDLIITSEIAEEYDALAAVNGSYFDMKVGGAWVFLQADGKQVAGNKSKVIFSHSGAFAEDTSGALVILKRPETDWEVSPEYKYVMSAGPIMIHEGEICEIDSVAFNLNRHPRTAVGLTKNDHLILVTVDGRQKEAVGMNIPELTELMKDLKCIDALNLDGGGSTTMYIKGKEHLGVVNYPTDNKKFDHAGQRPVSNAILLLK